MARRFERNRSGLIVPAYSRRRFIAGAGASLLLPRFGLLQAVPCYALGFTLIAQTKIAPGGPNGGTSPAIDTTGASIIVIAEGYSMFQSPITSDNKGNVAQACITVADGSFSAGAIIRLTANIGEAAPNVGPGHTFTVSAVNSNAQAVIAAFSYGKVPSSWQGAGHAAATGSNTSSATIASGPITPGQNNSLVFAAMGTQGPSAPASCAAPFTNLSGCQFDPGNAYGSFAAYYNQGTAAAINPTWTISGATGGRTALLTSFNLLPPAASGGPRYHSFPP